MSPDKSKWTLDEIKKFIDVLMELTLCSDIQELKDHIILESIWNRVEKKLSTDECHYDEKILKNLWYNYLHLQLFCTEPIYMNDIIIKLVECLRKEVLHAEVVHDINWNKVATYFDGITVIFLRRTFYNLMKIVKGRTKIQNLREKIDYLYNEYIPMVISSGSDKILPRIKYNEDSISYIDTNIEKQGCINNESMDESE